MKRKPKSPPLSLHDKYPPSEPCACDVCKSYCQRPGWWTVEEAESAIEAGYGPRMMLEMSPDFRFGVLSPAFRGCESNFALQQFSPFGCNFLNKGLCELFGTGFEPLECRFCHHTRKGQGPVCHAALEEDWRTAGQVLVAKWMYETRLVERYNLMGAEGRP